MIDRCQVWNLWEDIQLAPITISRLNEIEKIFKANIEAYQNVSLKTNIPAIVVAAIHYRESDSNFSTYLANGDPLFDANGYAIKTTHIPTGLGPYNSWSDAAIATLQGRVMQNQQWDVVSALIWCEKYNGLGYRRRDINSPYVWAGTNAYTSGKYGSDGNFDPTLIDQQVGCAAIFKLASATMRTYELIEIPCLTETNVDAVRGGIPNPKISVGAKEPGQLYPNTVIDVNGEYKVTICGAVKSVKIEKTKEK